MAGTFLWAFSSHQVASSPTVAEEARRLQDRLYGFKSAPYPVSYPVVLDLYSRHRLLLLAGIASIALLWKVPPGNRISWRQALVWLAGILLVSVGLPLLIQLLSGNPHTTATQRVLVRGLRFLFPLVFIQCLWALAVLERVSRRPVARCAVLTCGLLLSAVWLHANPPMLWPKELEQRGVWGRPRAPDTLAVLQVIRERTLPTARLLSFEDGQFDPVAIRYFSLRSLAYCYKDFGALGHTNDRALLKWGGTHAQYENLKRRPRDSNLLGALVVFARELGADHLLVYAPPFGSLDLPRDVTSVYENASYLLLRLNGTSSGD